MHTSNCAADDTKLSKLDRKFYTVCAAFLLIIWPLVAALGLYALGQPLPSLALLTSPRFLAMQIIVDYSMALVFVTCALLFNKRTAKHANVINELRRELAVSKDENGELQDELASVRAELEETRGRLDEAENELAQTQEWLYRTENVLEETRDWLCETDDALVQTRDRLEETEDELASVKFELSKAKLKLRLKEVKAQRAERCYESLRKTYSEATLDLLKTKRERDNLRRELVLARKVIRKLIAGRNKLRYELTEAKIGFEWFLSLYYEAEERIRFAKQQIERLENAQSELEETQKSERDKLQSELNEATEKVDWFRRKYFEVWRKTLRQSYNAKRQAVNLESILKNLDEATEIADLREKLKMVINRLSSEDSRE